MRSISAIAGLLVILLTGHLLRAQESGADSKLAMAELKRFKGTWEKQFTIYKSEWSPEEQKKTGTQTCALILDDQHLQETGRDSDGVHYMTVYSYDATTKVYRASVFQSSGATWQMSGQWDREKGTFTWTQELGDGVRMIANYTFLKPDQFKFNYTAKSRENQELFRLEGTAKRREANK